MELKLSCTDFSFPLLSHDQSLAVIAVLGLRSVDIGLFEGHGHLKPSRELLKPARNGAALAVQLGSAGLVAADIFLQLHAGFAEFALNHPDKKRRDFARSRFLKSLEYTVAAGSPHMTLLPGIHFSGETRARSIGRAAEELAWRVAEANASHIRIAVEPHVGSVIDTPTRTLDLVGNVPGLGLTLDYAHFTRAGFDDAAIEPLLRHASHLHARCARHRRLQCSLKENTIDFFRMLAGLNDHKFAGSIALEYVWVDWEHCNEVDVLSETVRLKQLLEESATQIK